MRQRLHWILRTWTYYHSKATRLGNPIKGGTSSFSVRRVHSSSREARKFRIGVEASTTREDEFPVPLITAATGRQRVKPTAPTKSGTDLISRYTAVIIPCPIAGGIGR